VGQPDIEADGLAAGLGGAAVGRLHDAPAAAGANDVSMSVRRQILRPRGDQTRQFSRCVVVVAQWTLRREPCGAEEHDRVANVFVVESVQRFEVLGEDAQGTRIVAIEELLVLVGEWFARPIDRAHGLWGTAAKSMKPRATSV